MRSGLVIGFFIYSLAAFSQTKSKNEPVSGVYQYKRQESKDATAYAIIKITLNKDHTFSYFTSSHIMGGSSEYKGAWLTKKDTLFLTNEDGSVDKYLISGKTICDMLDVDIRQTCLEKIK